MADEGGGTKIRRNNGGHQQPPPQMMMQGPPPPPDMDPQQFQQQQQVYQQMYEQQHQQPIYQPPQMAQGPLRSILKKSSFGGKENLKYPIIVSIIFLLLNSKLVWKQIIQLPFMGGVEPSMIALIVNAILAGVAFYFISKFT